MRVRGSKWVRVQDLVDTSETQQMGAEQVDTQREYE